MRVALVAMAAVIMIAPPARACDADDCASSVGLSCPGMQISVCPAGDFEMIKNGCGGTGDYIWVEIRDCGNNPIRGIPSTDFWINACDPARRLYLCAAPIIADSLTGTNGRTTLSGVLSAGGCVPSGGIWVAVQGKVIKGPYPSCTGNVCLPIIVKSPDMTGAGAKPDGIVNLSDLVPFGASYNKNLGQAGYNACCDYTDDNKCNLSDYAYFGTHYQHRCQ
jgi:hypothetical protein